MTSDAVTRVLAIWDGGSATYSFAAGQTVRIGRSPDADIAIALPSLSRRHAVVSTRTGPGPAGRARITDVGGMNGVSVSGERIPPNIAMPVGPGDFIELGGATLLLHAVDDGESAIVGAAARAAPRKPAADDGAVEHLIDVLAATELAVVLLGPAGAGKTYIASAIHARSARALGPIRFFACGGGTPDAIAADLFGRDSGEDAGAGMLETAFGGTLVLEDVAELSLATQLTLVEAIDRRSVVRLGGSKERPIDARLIATAKIDVMAAVAGGRLARQLYERLAGANVLVPGLRERTGEIARFAAKFLATAARPGRRAPRLSSEALGLLIRHPFYGNLRELRSVMEQGYARATAGFIGPEHLTLEAAATEPPPSILSVREPATRRFAPIAPTEPPTAPTEEIQILVPPAPPTPRPLPESPRKRRR